MRNPELAQLGRGWHVVFICILIAFFGTLHVLYQFGDLYGEHDAARFMADAIIWAQTGIRTVALSEYRYYVSPAYIYLAKLAYQASLVTKTHPEIYLDIITNFAAVVLIVPVYFLCSNLIGALGAFFTCFYLQLIPSYWYAGLYGFPTAIALFLTVVALLLWDLFVSNRLIIGPWAHGVLIFAFALSAMLMKADIWVLSTPALLGLVLVRRGVAWRHAAVAFFLAGSAILVSYGISHSLIQNAPKAAEYASDWNQKFSRANATAIGDTAPRLVDALRLYAMSLGIGSIPAAGLGLLAMLVNRSWKLAVATAVWLPTSFLFWAWRPADASRHHVPAALPAALAIGYLFAHAGRYRYVVYAFLAGVMVVNYVRYPPSDNTLSASGRLLRTAVLARDNAASIQRAAEAYVASTCNAVLIGAARLPYAEAALLLRARTVRVRLGVENGYPVREFTYSRDASSCTSTEVTVLTPRSALQAAELFKAQGRPVYFSDSKLGFGVQNLGAPDIPVSHF